MRRDSWTGGQLCGITAVLDQLKESYGLHIADSDGHISDVKCTRGQLAFFAESLMCNSAASVTDLQHAMSRSVGLLLDLIHQQSCLDTCYEQ